jgi:Flp pilus assembly protein TadD
MNRNITLKTAVVICSAFALAATVGGCAKRNDKLPESRARHARHLEAEDSFAAGAGRAPTAATSYAFAKILIAQGRDRDALYVLSHIVREHPKFLPAYNAMAGVYMRADRLDDAIAALTTGLDYAPKDGVLNNNLGMCHLLKNEPDKALASFTSATEAAPASATFRANRAAALALTARDAEAEREYQTVIGKLQARQNVLALARARESRAAAEDKHPAPQPAPVEKTDATTPAEIPAVPDISTPAS